MKINVKMMIGKIFSIDVKESEKIIELKRKIFEKTKIPIERQTLIFVGNNLLDENTLADYCLTDNNTIYLTEKIPSVPEHFSNEEETLYSKAKLFEKTLSLIVRSIDQKSIVISISNKASLARLKKFIAPKVGIPESHLNLIFGAIPLDIDSNVNIICF